MITNVDDHTVEGWESPDAGLPLTSALTDRFPFTHRHLSPTRLCAIISYAPFRERSWFVGN